MKVEPIRDAQMIADITQALEADETEAGRRRYLLWMCGIYLGRRVSDLTRMRVKDVYHRNQINIREQKTGKQADMYLFPGTPLYDALSERLNGVDPDAYVLGGKPRPITRRTAYRDMQAIKRMAGLPRDYAIGTHTLRKTFGYWYYQKTHDVATLMTLFNHSSERITLTYIGVGTDEKQQAYRHACEMYKTEF